MNARLATVLAPLLVALIVPASALGAGGGEAVGRNLGELLKSWAAAAFTGVAALVSLVFLLNRRYNELGLFVLAAIIVGGFVFAPAAVAHTIENVWTTLTR
jgi:hypothetical protein